MRRSDIGLRDSLVGVIWYKGPRNAVPNLRVAGLSEDEDNKSPTLPDLLETCTGPDVLTAGPSSRGNFWYNWWANPESSKPYRRCKMLLD